MLLKLPSAQIDESKTGLNLECLLSFKFELSDVLVDFLLEQSTLRLNAILITFELV